MVNENLLLNVFVQIVIVLITAHLLGALAERCGQAPVIGKIAAGILLGPTVLGHFAPSLHLGFFSGLEILSAIGQIGLVLIMFGLGLELEGERDDINRKTVTRASIIAFAGVFGGALAGVVAAILSYDIFGNNKDIVSFALFLATASAATAVPVLSRILYSLDMSNTRFGATVLLTATITDVLVWIVLSITIASVDGKYGGLPIWMQLSALVVLILVCEKLARPLLRRIRTMIRSGKHDYATSHIAIPLVVVFILSVVTAKLGLHVLLGAFIAGMVFRSERDLVILWRQKVEGFVEAFFVPIFFAAAGMNMGLEGAGWLFISLWVLFFFTIGTIGKAGGCYVAARMSGFHHKDAYAFGVLMNTKGLVELLILSIGLAYHVISKELFTILTIAALLSTVVTTPLLRNRTTRVEALSEDRIIN